MCPHSSFGKEVKDNLVIGADIFGLPGAGAKTRFLWNRFFCPEIIAGSGPYLQFSHSKQTALPASNWSAVTNNFSAGSSLSNFSGLKVGFRILFM
jgi:hypothetical protein